MKCPKCGQWNQSSFTRCMKCGEVLAAKGNHTPVGVKPAPWQEDIQSSTQKKYIHVDNDTGEETASADSREVLASHMVELKRRKVRGESRQRELRSKGAQRGYAPSNMNITRHTARTTFFTFENQETSNVKRVDNALDSELPVFDSLDDTGSLEIEWTRAHDPYYPRPQDAKKQKLPSRRVGLRRFFRFLLVIVSAALLVFGGMVISQIVEKHRTAQKEENLPIITASMQDDLAAHTIMIPGEDGQQIYVRELRLSYEVSGGYATLEVPDHIWYDDQDPFLQPTLPVTITPFLKTASGQQQPLDPITYEIDIPLSRIELLSPDVTRLEIATAMYSIKFRVQENSTVYVNDENLTDMVNLDGGDVTYNATVQPIGDNVFTISVRSQYCRENKVSVVLYRAAQEIPLDLASDTHTTSSSKSMQINATTLPGAYINVLTPHTDLDITNMGTSGSFSFYATFDHIGYNTITLTADYEGKQQSVLNYDVYYVPPAAEYTRKAWSCKDQYADLLANNSMRASQTQIYVCIGPIEYLVSDKPQLAVMNVGTEDEQRYVLLENNTRNSWVVGTTYRIYADAYGMYDDMPRLQARYTYKDD